MPNSLARKLERYVSLSEADRMWLADSLSSGRQIAARTDIIHEGDDPRAVNVILDGWACRYRQLLDGRRQIVSFLLPGDLCDPHVFLLEAMDHSIGAITSVLLGQISGAALRAMTARSPQLDLAFHRETLATRRSSASGRSASAAAPASSASHTCSASCTPGWPLLA